MGGKLYWITGLAGAGKTTIGNALYYELKKKRDNVLLLDGDILKKIIGENIGYSYAERLERAKRYSNLCKVLVDQGMTVIICTIAMFDSVREWNRKNVQGYIEIFLDVSIDVLMQRDRKGLYSRYKDGKVIELAGLDLDVEFPKNPDIVLKNDGSLSVKECVNRILEMTANYKEDYRRDAEYWNQYYEKSGLGMGKPSRFALDMLQYMQKGKNLLDLGCGNGRDSIFFVESGLRVTGIDASEKAIELLNQYYDKAENVIFICDDFVTSKALYQQQYDYCYSRFTIHAIDEKQELELLENVYNALKEEGRFFIEARSIHDDICGMGMQVGKHEYIYNNHYRRFLVREEFEERLQEKGFIIEYIAEEKGFSPNRDSDPVLIRVIARKSADEGCKILK